jgi:undecaprenyl-diphosphatase
MGETQNNSEQVLAHSCSNDYVRRRRLLVAIMMLLALLAFLVLAHFAVGQNGLTALDLQVSDQLRGNARESPHSKQVFHWITTCGNTDTLAILSLCVALLLTAQMIWRRRYQSLAAFWIIATMGVGLLNAELKDAFARPRPGNAPPQWGWSFPSGHSMGSFVVYGMLAYLIVLSVRQRAARNALVSALTLLVLAIGFSRVYLGAHWPSDVVGGFLAGTVWLTLCISGCEFTRRRPQRALTPVGLEASEAAPVA